MFECIQLEQDFIISHIVTIHYFDYFSNFSFPREPRNFWELLCVVNGEVVVSDKTRHILKKGDIIFHKPNEFHKVDANVWTAPKLVAVAFICHSSHMGFFEGKIFTMGERERFLLAEIIAEAQHAYTNPLNDPNFKKMERCTAIPFGAEQLIKTYIEQLLILLWRDNTVLPPRAAPRHSMGRNEDEIYEQLIAYLGNNLQTHITLDQVCRDNLMGRSQVQRLIRLRDGCGVIDLFCRMKIDAAKQLIRENHMNFTQIAYHLGYASVHYFSRQFKQIAGQTPSQYASSIKPLTVKTARA